MYKKNKLGIYVYVNEVYKINNINYNINSINHANFTSLDGDNYFRMINNNIFGFDIVKIPK